MVHDIMMEYLQQTGDINENANDGYSICGLKSYTVGKCLEEQALQQAVAGDEHRQGWLHIHDLQGSLYSAYCCGHDLRELLWQGLGSKLGTQSSSPKHFVSACDIIMNFMQILSNEWEGAQAISDVDVLLAPYIYEDLCEGYITSQKDVEQAVQSLIFGLNYESRQGMQCVTEDTDVLTPDGWKTYDQIKAGDPIYTWNDGKLNIQEVQRVSVYDHNGEAHMYSGRDVIQVVNEDHRVLYKKPNSFEFDVRPSKELIDMRTPMGIPVTMLEDDRPDYDITDDEIIMSAIILTDGTFKDYPSGSKSVKIFKSPDRYGNELVMNTLDNLGISYKVDVVNNGFDGHDGVVNVYTVGVNDSVELVELLNGDKTVLPEWVTELSRRQAQLFLDTWMKFDGYCERMRLQCDNEDIADQIQHVAFLAGYGSRQHSRKVGYNDKDTIYVTLYRRKVKDATTKERIHYTGKMWCPTTDDGLVVYRKDGKVFVSGNTPFTNFTMRIYVPDEMKDEPVLCHGELKDYTYRDMQPYMDMFNEALFDVLISGDTNGKPFTFPIPTITVDTPDMFQTGSEVPVLDKLWQLTEKFGSPYFANYLGAGGNPEDAKSMCPLSPDTEVIVKTSGNGVTKSRISEIVNNITQKGTVYHVWTDEGWNPVRPVQLPKSRMYRVTMSNGDSVKMDARHLQPTMDTVKRADELEIGDWLPYNKKVVDKFPHNGYYLGYSIGAYIGDGSRSSSNSVTYTINKNKLHVRDNLLNFWCGSMEYDITFTENENVMFIRVNGNSYETVKRFVNGNNALEKSLTNKVYNASHDFREGLLDGLKDTDGRGNKRNSIYTSSAQMRNDLCTVLSMMGYKHMCNYEDNRDGRLGTNTNYRVDFPMRNNYGNLYKEDEDYVYHQITNIEEIDIKSDYTYCFEVDSEKHLFMLANGLMTHNCRLNLDVDKVRRATGIWDKGVKTGSLGVCTLNLNRVGIVSRSIDEYLNNLNRLFNVATQQLLQRKDYVRAAFYDYGLMPYSYKYVGTLESFFLTVGVAGAWEAYHNLIENAKQQGYRDDMTYTQFSETVLNYLNELLERNETETDWKLWNLEQTPAEGSSNRLAALDNHYYPDAYVSGDNSGYFLTNSTHPAVYYNEWDVVDTLMFHDRTDKLYTGGTLKNIFIDNINSVDGIMNFIKNVVSNTEIPYVAYTPIYGICSKHGVCKQRTEECPECGERMPVFTRVVGYIRPMDKFNPGQYNQACLRRYDANNEDVEKVYAGDGMLGR